MTVEQLSNISNQPASSEVSAKPPGPTPDTIKKQASDPITKPDNLWLKIDDRWYDLTKWQFSHPGGQEILQHLKGQDATDAFYSLHSKEARMRLKKLWSVPCTPENDSTKPPTQATLNFRKFRIQLEQDGWFDKQFGWELVFHSSVYILALIGTLLTLLGKGWMSWLMAFLCVSLSMEQSGWIAHDYTHMRGTYAKYGARMVGGFINAFSTSWWSDKHNTHHVYTNHTGIDRDIENDPVIHLAFPTGDKDVWYRKLQHIYLMPVLSLLFVSWRTQSAQWAWKTRHWSELFMMTVNYLWLLFILGPMLAIPSVLMAGFLCAIIVTATHQSEEILIEQASPLQNYSFVECQFATTRDVWMTSNFMNWLWGGMQYQLEHHLFPTMPKYNYRKLIPLVKKFAQENGIDYKVDTLGQILARNYQTIKFYAGEQKEDVLKVPGLKLTPSQANLQQYGQQQQTAVKEPQALSEQLSEDLEKTKQYIEMNIKQRVKTLKHSFNNNAPQYPVIVPLSEE